MAQLQQRLVDMDVNTTAGGTLNLLLQGLAHVRIYILSIFIGYVTVAHPVASANEHESHFQSKSPELISSLRSGSRKNLYALIHFHWIYILISTAAFNDRHPLHDEFWGRKGQDKNLYSFPCGYMLIFYRLMKNTGRGGMECTIKLKSHTNAYVAKATTHHASCVGMSTTKKRRKNRKKINSTTTSSCKMTNIPEKQGHPRWPTWSSAIGDWRTQLQIRPVNLWIILAAKIAGIDLCMDSVLVLFAIIFYFYSSLHI